MSYNERTFWDMVINMDMYIAYKQIGQFYHNEFWCWSGVKLSEELLEFPSSITYKFIYLLLFLLSHVSSSWPFYFLVSSIKCEEGIKYP